ncbi:MAG: nucleotidyltransferase family protein [Clostridia bacterium]|nr:nucleotidyltransferase family protein [Clostridia bacterium]
MQVAGIIAEYDPFHKGHAAHIQATRENGATHIAVVLSGSFTQRGEPAMFSKFARAEMALAGGADLVIELPLPWSMAPAERFAEGGVALLHALGCVDTLSFGSECGRTETLEQLAVLTESPSYRHALQQAMATGIPYAAAGQAAAEAVVGKESASLLDSPNNTLGLEYIRAARRLGANFRFFTLSRQGALHNETAPKQGYASGSLLRQMLKKESLAETEAYLPATSFSILQGATASGDTVLQDGRLGSGILARLRQMTPEQMKALPYLSEGLENRLYRAAQTATTIEELYAAVKTKRYPLSRIRRLLWAAMLGMEATDVVGQPPYIRVLGMNERGQEILATAKPSLPLVSRASQVEELSEEARRIHRLECGATDLRGLLLSTPQPCGADQTAKFLRI